MASAFARSGARVIASAAVAISSQFPSSNSSSSNHIENEQEPGSMNPSFRQLSSKEVGDAARTIFGGKNESTNNSNNNNTNNNGPSAIQLFHSSLNPVALALGQQLAEDPRIQQSIYEHMREKWSVIAKGGGIEKEINLSDAEEEEFSGIHTPIASDIEGEDWSHLSRNQILLSPELFTLTHQSVPLHASNDNNDHDEGIPANHQSNQQQYQSPSSFSTSSTDSKNNQSNHNNPHSPENKNNEEVGIIDRLVRWVGSLFTPSSDDIKIDQRNNNNATNQSSTSSSASNVPPAGAPPTSFPSRLKHLLGNIEIYQMAIAVAAMIVFVAIFRRPPPKF